jgi:predicted transposase
VKTTIKAILVNPSEDQSNVINNLMLVFCTAVRFAFSRLLEGVEIKELEKEISRKYNLNIRQAKDAVESM